MYTYKDFVTGKVKRTNGKFIEWHRGGPLNALYAKFQCRVYAFYVPEYCLTKETKQQLPERPRE